MVAHPTYRGPRPNPGQQDELVIGCWSLQVAEALWKLVLLQFVALGVVAPAPWTPRMYLSQFENLS